MNNKRQKFLVRIGMLALVAFLALPLTAFAQDNGRGRGRDRNRDNDSWQREQAERARIEAARHEDEIRRQDELERQGAENLRRQQERARNNNDWQRNNNDNYGRNSQYERNRRGRNWDRYSRSGGSFQLRQTALNAGYNNGIQEGRKDRSHGDRFDYRDEGDYQKATEDYSSRLGDRELYKRYFREGFQNGYEDGYRGY
ncbi:MAG TPA: hypothetical protein VGO68_17535 [Pyrinomonadaceae bacterium]|jgi:hypothetical protein|nr:hypothetical protein [Pyrinomonadaceae bacterium]